MTVSTTRLPEHTCPACGAVHDAGTSIGREPRPGDVSLCVDCGTMSDYTAEGTVRALSHSELLLLIDENPAVLQTMMAWVRLKKERSTS